MCVCVCSDCALTDYFVCYLMLLCVCICSDGALNDKYGVSVSVDSSPLRGYVMVGAYFAGSPDRGGAYLYPLPRKCACVCDNVLHVCSKIMII